MRLACRQELCVIAAAMCFSLPLLAQDSIEEIAVIGSRSSLASALSKQRNADQIVGVVDSDALGNFADINVAESLRRLAGIMVENDQGEGRYVSVRGLNTDLNAMTINGVSTASPEDRRGIILDGVPTDLLESMTVYKSLTPNLDADTIGGAINLETITAFSRDGRFFRLKGETSYNELSHDSSNPKLSATFSDRWKLGDGELGIAAVISDQTRRIVAQNNENGGWGNIAPNEDYELRYYDLQRERQGLVFNIDYQSISGNTFYVHLFHNRYIEEEGRAKFETRRVLEEEPISITEGTVFTYDESRVDTESKNRREIREISSFQFGAELAINEKNRVHFELFGSEAEQDDTEGYNAIFRSDKLSGDIIYDNSRPEQPAIAFPADFYDPTSYTLKTWESEIAMNTDQDIGARVDFFTSLTQDSEIQYGLKYRQREKRNDFNLCGYDPVDDILLSDFGFETISPYLNSIHGPAPSVAQVKASKANLGSGSYRLSDGTTCPNPGAFFEPSGDEEEESIAADWSTDEDVLAAYFMATTILERSTWVYGLRYEDTETIYRGKNFDGSRFAGANAFGNRYSFLAPSLNVKFDLADDQIVRIGAFRSLVRPGFKQSRAGAEIDVEDNEIRGGNPALEPTTAWNFDITYELYLGDETFFGAGVFHKQLSDSIVEVESSDAFLRGQFWNIANTYINTDDSDIIGYELSFQTAFDNGFVFQANYTNSDGESQLPADSVNGQRAIPFFKQAEHSANMALGFDKGRWDIRLAGNYRGKYLDEVGDEDLADRYTDDHLQIDLTAKFDVSDQLVISAEVINLNDEPEYYYYGNRSRLAQYDEYGTTYGLGLRYTF